MGDAKGRPPRPAGRPRTNWYPEKTFGETRMWDNDDVITSLVSHWPTVLSVLGCFASLFLSAPFLSFSFYMRTPLSPLTYTSSPSLGPLPPSLSRAHSLTCSLSLSHVAARDISVSLCCTPTTGLDPAVESLRARSQWAQRLEPIFGLHEGLYKVYTRDTDNRGSSVPLDRRYCR